MVLLAQPAVRYGRILSIMPNVPGEQAEYTGTAWVTLFDAYSFKTLPVYRHFPADFSVKALELLFLFPHEVAQLHGLPKSVIRTQSPTHISVAL